MQGVTGAMSPFDGFMHYRTFRGKKIYKLRFQGKKYFLMSQDNSRMQNLVKLRKNAMGNRIAKKWGTPQINRCSRYNFIYDKQANMIHVDEKINVEASRARLSQLQIKPLSILDLFDSLRDRNS